MLFDLLETPRFISPLLKLKLIILLKIGAYMVGDPRAIASTVGSCPEASESHHPLAQFFFLF